MKKVSPCTQIIFYKLSANVFVTEKWKNLHTEKETLKILF